MRPTRTARAIAATSTVLALAACGGAEPPTPASDPAAHAPPVETSPIPPTAPAATEPATIDPAPASEPAEGLPAAVAGTREAIVAAAHRRDYGAFGALLDPATFSYSFGESGDPIGYWQQLEGEAELPVLGDVLPLVLGMPVAIQDGIYVWPSASTRPPSEWTAAEVDSIARLYPAEDIEGFRAVGGYLGWRVGIRADGTWLYFVAGD